MDILNAYLGMKHSTNTFKCIYKYLKLFKNIYIYFIDYLTLRSIVPYNILHILMKIHLQFIFFTHLVQLIDASGKIHQMYFE